MIINDANISCISIYSITVFLVHGCRYASGCQARAIMGSIHVSASIHGISLRQIKDQGGLVVPLGS